MHTSTWDGLTDFEITNDRQIDSQPWWCCLKSTWTKSVHRNTGTIDESQEANDRWSLNHQIPRVAIFIQSLNYPTLPYNPVCVNDNPTLLKVFEESLWKLDSSWRATVHSICILRNSDSPDREESIPDEWNLGFEMANYSCHVSRLIADCSDAIPRHLGHRCELWDDRSFQIGDKSMDACRTAIREIVHLLYKWNLFGQACRSCLKTTNSYNNNKPSEQNRGCLGNWKR